LESSVLAEGVNAGDDDPQQLDAAE